MMEKVFHREDGFASMNPYIVSVYFDTEPGVKYEYYIKNEEEIFQSGYGMVEGFNHEMIHLERE